MPYFQVAVTLLCKDVEADSADAAVELVKDGISTNFEDTPFTVEFKHIVVE